MKWGGARLWLTGVSLGAVLILVLHDVRERPSPGPLAPVHEGLPELSGTTGCEACHAGGESSMRSACGACHDDVEQDLARGAGFHGAMKLESREDCGACHVEHYGAELPLVGELAFALAGVSDVRAFEHGHVEFGLQGAHDDLGCEDCHPIAFAERPGRGELRFGDATQRCVSCHEDPHRGDYSDDCSRCHGQELPFAAVASFEHPADLPLAGPHAGIACEECHAPGSARSIVALSDSTRPAAARGCVACHASPHREEFVAGVADLEGLLLEKTCGTCHDERELEFSEAGLEPAQHVAAGFDLDVPHAELECDACHQESFAPASSFAVRHPGRGRRSCEACHDDPHDGQFESGAFAGSGCAVCHADDAFLPARFGVDLHARSDFPLRGSHRDAACEACHGAGDSPSASLRFADAGDRCSDCHADAHRGRLVGEDSQDCAQCHQPTRFADRAREGFDHEGRTAFALEGAHVAATCELCHRPRRTPDRFGRRFGRAPAASRGSGPGEGCASCHEDVHGGSFDGGGLPERVDGRTGCARCHRSTDFRDLHGPGFDHLGWTGFPLAGAHDAIACQACHGVAPPGAGRSLGLVAERYGARGDRCADCHDDPHRGRFSRDGSPVLGATSSSCELCHDTEDFRGRARDGFDHGGWTGFVLEGEHARTRCEACHVEPRQSMRLGRTPGGNCEDCHSDPHVAQFSVGGRTDCAGCHVGSESFTRLHFDHALDSRFTLDEQHSGLACSACHRPWPLPGGGKAVRYKPLGVECTDCHRAAEGERGR